MNLPGMDTQATIYGPASEIAVIGSNLYYIDTNEDE